MTPIDLLDLFENIPRFFMIIISLQFFILGNQLIIHSKLTINKHIQYGYFCIAGSFIGIGILLIIKYVIYKTFRVNYTSKK